jgi:hypothetical protein
LFGSSNYNAILEGALEVPEDGPWSEALLKGKLTLISINLTHLRNLAFFKQSLPSALVTEGSASAYSRFEGTWANLRMGALIKAEKGAFRYRDWLRKPSGSLAELKAQISRQKTGLVLHESELRLGNSKMTLSVLLKRRRSLDCNSSCVVIRQLPPGVSWFHQCRFMAPVEASIGTCIGKESCFGGRLEHPGKLKLTDAEFKHKETGRRIDHLNARYRVFRNGSSAGKRFLSFRFVPQYGHSQNPTPNPAQRAYSLRSPNST